MEDIQILRSSQLLQNIEPDQIRIILDFRFAVLHAYQKGEFILHRGEHTRRLGVVLGCTALSSEED